MMEPKFVDREAFTVLGTQIHSMPDKLDFGSFWENTYMPLDAAIHPLSTDGAYYGVWFPHHADGIPDYLAGMAVPDDAPAPEGTVKRQVPGSRFAVFECTIDEIGATYGYIYGTWLPASPYEFTPGGADFEYYPPEDVTDASPAVWIPIRHKAGHEDDDD
jgi:predicted transcriptional regulator YdeE